MGIVRILFFVFGVWYLNTYFFVSLSLIYTNVLFTEISRFRKSTSSHVSPSSSPPRIPVPSATCMRFSCILSFACSNTSRCSFTVSTRICFVFVLGTSTPAHGLNVRILLCTAYLNIALRILYTSRIVFVL